MTLSRLLARPMLSAVFIAGGIDTLRNPGPKVKMSEDVATSLASKTGLPQDPDLLVKLNAGAQVAGGLLLATGRFRRLGALVLIGSTLPTTYAGHRFWEADDPQDKSEQQMHFLKNVGLLGGLLLELFDTEGAPSLGWRSRRAARSAAGALAAGAASSRSASGDRAGRAAKRAKQQTAVTRKQARQAARKATDHASSLAASQGQQALQVAGHAGSLAASQGHQARQVAGHAGSLAASQSKQARKAAKHAGDVATKQLGQAWNTASDYLPVA